MTLLNHTELLSDLGWVIDKMGKYWRRGIYRMCVNNVRLMNADDVRYSAQFPDRVWASRVWAGINPYVEAHSLILHSNQV